MATVTKEFEERFPLHIPLAKGRSHIKAVRLIVTDCDGHVVAAQTVEFPPMTLSNTSLLPHFEIVQVEDIEVEICPNCQREMP
jgi:hypothetical protein